MTWRVRRDRAASRQGYRETRVSRRLSVPVILAVVAAATVVAAACSSGARIDRTSAAPNPTHEAPATAPSALATPTSAPASTTLPPGPDVRFAGLLLATDGWALTSTGLYFTTDGGVTWRPATVPGPRTGRGVLGVTFATPQEGWLATLYSADPRSRRFDVWRTLDGGRSWQRTVLPEGANSSETMGTVWFSRLDPAHLFLLVEGGMADGWASDLYESSDGGATWSPDRITPGGVTGTLAFADAKHGVIAGGAPGTRLFATDDAGASWRGVTLPAPFGTTPAATPPRMAPTFWSATEGTFGMIYGTDVGPTAFGILRTADAGASWSLAGSRPLPSHDYGAALAFLGPAVWLAMPDAATLLRTADAGQSWTTSPATGLPDRPDVLDFADAQRAWALVSLSACTGFKSNCTAREGLYSTTDGGVTWTALWPGKPR